jgi:hypothetical protein
MLIEANWIPSTSGLSTAVYFILRFNDLRLFV